LQNNEPKTSKGLIALDIDGTITDGTHLIHPKVSGFLHSLHQVGWELIFITGRSFQWSYRTLSVLPFSFGLAVQNGAILLDMPSKQILATKQLDHSIIPQLEKISVDNGIDCVIYGGFTQDDRCFYRPQFYHPDLLKYLLKRKNELKENWQEIECYSELPLKEFASIKYFSSGKEAEFISRLISEQLSLHAPYIRDAYDSRYAVIQATHPEATKGNALERYIDLKKIRGPVIAAGDDKNDLTMLLKADMPIAMENAPDSLLKLARVVAPLAEKQGIIEGLSSAIQKLSTIGD